jgi:hypothetical protein
MISEPSIGGSESRLVLLEKGETDSLASLLDHALNKLHYEKIV